MPCPAAHVDVLVVGAGPTGLALAAQVRRHGASVRVVDRDPEQVHESQRHARAGPALFDAALGLSGGVTRSTDSLRLDAGPTDRYLGRAWLGALWCYQQMLTLPWAHFTIPDRGALDEITRSAGAVSSAKREHMLGSARERVTTARLLLPHCAATVPKLPPIGSSRG